ncbi:hypothetical protein LINPERHAP2_LOCUS4468 [Linum perenne]
MLSITRSARLTEVCGFERLQLLESLYISCCSAIRKLPNLSGLKQLKKLDILECVQLSEVMGLENLESLQELIICKCTLIKTLPDLSGLTFVNLEFSVSFIFSCHFTNKVIERDLSYFKKSFARSTTC